MAIFIGRTNCCSRLCPLSSAQAIELQKSVSIGNNAIIRNIIYDFHRVENEEEEKNMDKNEHQLLHVTKS